MGNANFLDKGAQQFSEFIEIKKQEKCFTIEDLESISGISSKTISRVLKGEKDILETTFYALLGALDTTPQEFHKFVQDQQQANQSQTFNFNTGSSQKNCIIGNKGNVVLQQSEETNEGKA